MKVHVIILQGAPGSGKSFWAEQFRSEQEKKGVVVLIFSADRFRYQPVMEDGKLVSKYIYRPEENGRVHALCRSSFISQLAQIKYASLNLSDEEKSTRPDTFLIVDNTNVHKWEAEPYIEAAQILKADTVTIRRFNGTYPNVHGVPPEHVDRMRSTLQNLYGLFNRRSLRIFVKRNPEFSFIDFPKSMKTYVYQEDEGSLPLGIRTRTLRYRGKTYHLWRWKMGPQAIPAKEKVCD